MHVRTAVIVALGATLAGASYTTPPPAPIGVSPGAATGATIADSCPTFSWSRLEGAAAYELVVYRFAGPTEDRAEDTAAAEEPVLTERIPGDALSWTPSLDRCLERGATYAWSVRAATAEGPSGWAAPLFVEVTAKPSAEELEAALEVVRRYLELEDPGASAAPAPLSSRKTLAPRSRLATGTLATSRPEPGPGPEGESREAPPTVISAAPAPVVAGGGSAALTVHGEVRSVDSAGQPRLWGRGRATVSVYTRPIVNQFCTNFAAGGIKFGLSNIMVDWASAAEACPLGTWVCSSTELIPCDTARPDTTDDARTCDGSSIDLVATDHAGWVAERIESPVFDAAVFRESGASIGDRSCLDLPAWCCWR